MNKINLKVEITTLISTKGEGFLISQIYSFQYFIWLLVWAVIEIQWNCPTETLSLAL